ncbi:MAG TPA: exodeoxyribonuclease VII small subunit [Nevskiaceae bacterium]|nr:exodeoxyribonuclease VII small subunit [Nevskiaceae bacterium]
MTQKADYQSVSAQLDRVLAALQQPDVHVDEAVGLYEQGLKLVEQLEAHLHQAENKLTKLKLQAG